MCERVLRLGATAAMEPCPVCGIEVTGWEFLPGIREVTHGREPAWEGGPLLSVPLPFPRLERVPRDDVYKVTPCGHAVDREAVTVTIRLPDDVRFATDDAPCSCQAPPGVRLVLEHDDGLPAACPACVAAGAPCAHALGLAQCSGPG